MSNPEDAKDKFHEDIDSFISSVPQNDKFILLGNFNARVGSDHQVWERVLGKQGIGKCTCKGLLLLRACATHNLSIANTIFQLSTRNKTSWMHRRSKHWHLIDYVIVKARDRRDVHITKAMCGAECWTILRLIVSKMKLSLRPVRRTNGKKSSKS